MARSEAPIDWDKVKIRMEAGSSGAEIAGFLDIAHDTFYRRFKKKYKIGFDAMSRRRKDGGDSNIRVRQYTSALQGNTRMLEKLGDLRLGQGKDAQGIGTDEARAIIACQEKINRLESALHSRGISLSDVQIEQSLSYQGCSREESQISDELGTTNIMGAEAQL